MNAVAPPNSPPAENPCSSRAAKIPSGAASPIDAARGMHAIIAVPIVINQIDTVMAARRPCRSA
jgi:hypothetical protein